MGSARRQAGARSAEDLEVATREDGAVWIARRARRPLRAANRLPRRVREFAQAGIDGELDAGAAADVLAGNSDDRAVVLMRLSDCPRPSDAP